MNTFSQAVTDFSKAIDAAMVDARDCDFKRIWPHIGEFGGVVSFCFPDVVQIKFKCLNSVVQFNIGDKKDSKGAFHSSDLVNGDNFVTNIEITRGKSNYINIKEVDEWEKILELVPPSIPFKSPEVDKYEKEPEWVLKIHEDVWVE